MQKNPAFSIRETDAAGPVTSEGESGGGRAPDPHPPSRGNRSGLGAKISNQTDVSAENSGILFEPVSHQPYDLSYACLLIPRFNNHYLSGDLVDFLYGWIHDACISFSWKLESVDIQAAYLQWLLSVPFAIPPAHFIRVIRQHTSRRIFEEFPRFKKENISDDFWAPGHLVIVGRRLHTPEMITEFIRLTRQQQGVAFIHRR